MAIKWMLKLAKGETQLKTGILALKSYLYRIRQVASNQRACGGEGELVAHFLLRCNNRLCEALAASTIQPPTLTLLHFSANANLHLMPYQAANAVNGIFHTGRNYSK